MKVRPIDGNRLLKMMSHWKPYMLSLIHIYNGTKGTFERLEISIDVAEGEFKDFYATDYRGQNQEDKKWRGVLRLYVPKDDGSDMDEWTKSKLKACLLYTSHPLFIVLYPNPSPIAIKKSKLLLTE